MASTIMSTSLLATSDSVFVIIDVQQRLAGAMPAEINNQVLKQLVVLLQATQVLAIPTLVTEQYPKGLGPTEAELTEHFGDAIKVIEKTCFSSLNSDEFAKQIAATGRQQIILTGMEAHICVLQTALQLQEKGYQVFVVEDAVSSRVKANQDNAMHRLRQAGVVVTNTESVLFEWLRDAKHTYFKTLSRLIV